MMESGCLELEKYSVIHMNLACPRRELRLGPREGSGLRSSDSDAWLPQDSTEYT
jgi:hypothetical protein